MPPIPPVKTIYIIGPPRTGSTLLVRLLAGGDGVLALSEPLFLRILLPRWLLKICLFSVPRARRDRVLRAILPRSWLPYAAQRAPIRPRLKRAPLPHNGDVETFSAYLRDTAAANGLQYLVIKELFRATRLDPPWCNCALLEGIVGSEATVIAIVRHPCDAVYSTAQLLGKALFTIYGPFIRRIWGGVPDFRNHDDIVAWTADNWANFVVWAAEHRLYTVRYEDLVTRPEQTMRDLCMYTGIAFHERMLDHEHAPVAFGGIGAPEVVLRPLKPVHTDSLGRGRALTAGQIECVRTACAKAAAELGYTI